MTAAAIQYLRHSLLMFVLLFVVPESMSQRSFYESVLHYVNLFSLRMLNPTCGSLEYYKRTRFWNFMQLLEICNMIIFWHFQITEISLTLLLLLILDKQPTSVDFDEPLLNKSVELQISPVLNGLGQILQLK